MKTLPPFAIAVSLLLLPGCSSEAAPSTASKPSGAAGPTALTQDDLDYLWPAPNCKVLDEFDLVVGYGELTVQGQIEALLGDEPVATFPPGANAGPLKLPAGEQKVTIRVLDHDGKPMGSEWSKEVTYNVVEAPAEQKVWFIEPADGATVSTKFKVKFGVSGMGMSKAGENVSDKTVGHHHLLIDHGPMFPSTVVPTDETHLHYGMAQTEAEIELPPGEHTLTMQFADAAHMSYGERMAATIRVTVE